MEVLSAYSITFEMERLPKVYKADTARWIMRAAITSIEVEAHRRPTASTPISLQTVRPSDPKITSGSVSGCTALALKKSRIDRLVALS